ncbi:solute carrier family 41 member 1 isoform X1 [Cryptotermes secundus]|uniref:solute carrier family 41 member 1 isoform X1 n=1 Tax=Cryptotermes secundus TaxID=105785 RepID=UPI001454C662|nr:solute carrier family 41 member 1 isoform X1 [Cryptotermes secundus]
MKHVSSVSSCQHQREGEGDKVNHVLQERNFRHCLPEKATPYPACLRTATQKERIGVVDGSQASGFLFYTRLGLSVTEQAGLPKDKGANRDETFWRLTPSSPGAGSLHSVASIDTVASTENGIIKPEKWWSTTLQVAVPFFLAGIGTIGAGLTLGVVQNWAVFRDVTSLLILVPPLLGLKGNLDMCLASRLSTQANMGKMDSWREIWKMIVGNVAVVQVQAIVAALLVSLFAVSMNAIIDGWFNLNHALLLSAASITTATSSCFILDLVMIGVIVVTHRLHMNPDNLATPVAASIGDVVSISLLAQIASAFFHIHDTAYWILLVLIVIYLLLLPFWIYIVLNNEYTRPVLTSGWVPVLSALIISGLGGLVLDNVVDLYSSFVVFQPIINGIGGNLVSIQSSRISTMLHQSSLQGIIPPHTRMCATPWAALFKGLPHASTARILISMNLTGQVMFLFVADYIHWGQSTVTAAFALSYLTVSLLQVMILLYTAHLLIHLMWKWKVDPDNSAIPFLTALGDVLGSSLLALAFFFLDALHLPYSN